MKNYIHSRLSKEDRIALETLKKATGHSESELIRHGLRLLYKELRTRSSALELAGRSVGKFKNGPRDLSTNENHMDDFGK